MAVQTQLVRDQHLVPQWHLRNFADVSGDLWRYMQDRPVKRSRPKGECWELDFYEYELNGKKTNNKYENWLGRIENDAAAILQSLLNHSQLLGQRNATIWAAYVASLFIRSQKYRMQVSAAMTKKFKEQTQSRDFVRDLQHDLLKKGELVFAEDLEKDIERLRTNMENSPSFYHVVGLQRLTASLGEALMSKTWHILQAPPGTCFLTSDCPVMTAEFVDNQAMPGAGFGKERTAIMLPVSPQHLFVAASPLSRWKSVLEPRHVHSLNLLTVRFAHKRVYAPMNSLDIKALVDVEINTILFGKNAFLPQNQN
jgi:hypothetical protein